MKYLPLFIALCIIVSFTFGLYFIINSFFSAALFPRQLVFKFLEKNDCTYLSHSAIKKNHLIQLKMFEEDESIVDFIYKNYYFEIISRNNTDNQIMKYYLKFSKSRTMIFGDKLIFNNKN